VYKDIWNPESVRQSQGKPLAIKFVMDQFKLFLLMKILREDRGDKTKTIGMYRECYYFSTGEYQLLISIISTFRNKKIRQEREGHVSRIERPYNKVIRILTKAIDSDSLINNEIGGRFPFLFRFMNPVELQDTFSIYKCFAQVCPNIRIVRRYIPENNMERKSLSIFSSRNALTRIPFYTYLGSQHRLKLTLVDNLDKDLKTFMARALKGFTLECGKPTLQYLWLFAVHAITEYIIHKRESNEVINAERKFESAWDKMICDVTENREKMLLDIKMRYKPSDRGKTLGQKSKEEWVDPFDYDDTPKKKVFRKKIIRSQEAWDPHEWD
jgi:hypothetical protein